MDGAVVWEHVLDLRDKFDRTMIVTSHPMDEIDEFCDRIALIDRGRIAAVGTSAELKMRVQAVDYPLATPARY